jgi:hypothetical protein
MKKNLIRKFLFICIIPLTACAHQDWRNSDRSSAGLAPSPKDEPKAVVQVYSARAFRWRGYFGVHSWIATKEKDSDHYITYHVMGYRLERTGTTLVVEEDIPDRRWFGAVPTLIHEIRGEKAASAIPKIQAAVNSYPYPKSYRLWPGPNSNTFISYILRNVPELGVELPPHALGKDWLAGGDFFAKSESGTGGQFSIFGVFGATAGLAEGIELNLLGMSFGIDFWRPALKLPFLGRLGFKDAPVFD